MRCDMCDSEEELFKTRIEGAELTVCEACSRYGEVISKVAEPAPKKEPAKQLPKRREVIFIINEDYPGLIKRKREKLGLKQEELAKEIGEKTSVIHQLETGSIEPNIDLARKLEKFLKLRLVEEYEESGTGTKTKSKELTIGDMVDIG